MNTDLSKDVDDVLTQSFGAIVSRWTLPVMMLDDNFEFVYANQSYLDAVERSWEDLKGKHVFEAFPDEPENVAYVHNKFKRTFEGETTRLSAQPFALITADGIEETRNWQAVQEPIFNAAGDVTHLVQYAEDVTQRVRAEEETKLMAQEMSHRIKNMLAVIQSITRMSSKGHKSLETFLSDFTARLGAIGRSHARLISDGFDRTDIETILSQELEAMSVNDRKTYSFNGIPMQLSEANAKDLSMVIHELATNAAKYGCFSKDDGHLDVSWQRTGETIVLKWRETGMGEMPDIIETGFGSRLISMMQTVKMERIPESDGLSATLTISLK